MIITNMNDGHVSQVAQLEKLCFSDPWSENSIASELENPLALWLVAEKNGAVVGYVGSQTVMDETDMMNIAVHPDHRRQGIAEALIEALIAVLKRKGSYCLTLEVRASNENARRLYEKLGFCQAGIRKNYYRNPREDAIILRKEWNT
ncbi:MAG: ribosomal-protein-alanine N-acetyltransferase [Ruminococcaceae bacterium]|nr:ribosomal-protein-alanine N-acetyltransferase [Oscillospiraceae bacterium]